jgi:hypothetical protein
LVGFFFIARYTLLVITDLPKFMKIGKFILIIFFILTGCIPAHKHYTADLQLNTASPESGQPLEMTFQIKDPAGKNFSDLEIIHEKPMHLFMVSRDLSQYFHEHPEKQTDGTFKLPYTFQSGGKFKIFIDFKPPDDEQTVESFDLEVKGEKLPEIKLIPDKKFEKTIGGILVKMKPNIELIKQKDVLLNFQVFDAVTQEPVTDLQNYLGEKAHFVIIRKGLGRFVHAHPMSADKMNNMNTNQNMNAMNMDKMPMSANDRTSKITAMTNFPNRGIYKIFAQFKRNDKVITVPFVFEVR